MTRPAIAAVIVLAACTNSVDKFSSDPADPTDDFVQPPPGVDTGWPTVPSNEADTDADTDSDADTDTDADSDADTDTDADTDADTSDTGMTGTTGDTGMVVMPTGDTGMVTPTGDTADTDVPVDTSSTADTGDTSDTSDTSAPPPTLPLVITDYYQLTGYFSEWNGGDEWTTVRESETAGTCLVRPPLALGDCMQVTYNRDPDGDAAGPAWSGFYWQAQGLWDAGTGLDMPDGATQLSFWAWGATGGEVMEFKAGCAGCGDAFELSTGNLTLTAVPTQYTIDFTGQDPNGEFVGAFAWATNSAPVGNVPVTFYVDNIVWQ